MKRFLNTTRALFRKDFNDTLRNASMTILLLMPPAFGAVFRFMSIMDLGSGYILKLTTVMCACMIPLSFLATIIAEEKEKHTLRALMLAGVSAAEFLLSKVLVSFVLMQAVNIADFLIAGYAVGMLFPFLLVTTFGSVGLFFLGAMIGILSRDQMSTSLLSVPVMMMLLLPSTVGLLSPFFGAIAEYSPVEWMTRLFDLWETGKGFTGGLKGVIVILLWTAAGYIAFHLAYKRKRLDA